MTTPTITDSRTDAINAYDEQLRLTLEVLKATDLAWLNGPEAVETLADRITRRIWTAALTEARHELERVLATSEDRAYWRMQDAVNVVRAPEPVAVRRG